ncbi:MAG: TonB-dependent receptor [Alphaproteobacteria bacterium]|nr:MAG: TonB-dependent receptor [Alphaproteobacteria bacterium]
MKYYGKYLGSVSIIAGMFLPINVWAEDSKDEKKSFSGIDEIVITARKFEESLQDAPIAISAFTAHDLEERNLSTVTDVGDFAPNVKFNSSMPISASNATVALFIRGIGQNDYQLSADPGVGLYLDGVYISRNVGNVLDILNLERVEILRGPQGTLFGRNTIGGAVNVVTKKPDETLGGNLELTTGRWNRVQTKFSVNLPVSDGLYVNASGIYHKRDGYVKGIIDQAPDLGDTNQAGGRIAVRWAPEDQNFELNVAVDGSRAREESSPNVLLAINESPSTFVGVWNAAFSGAGAICGDISNPARLSNPACLNAQYVLAPFEHAGTWDSIISDYDQQGGRRYESASDIDVWGISAILDWDISESVSFKSITAYRSVVGYWTRDSDHTPASITQTKNFWDQSQFSQELQLQGIAAEGKVKWVVGAYYSDESGDHLDLVEILDAYFASGALVDGNSLAFFGQATYDISDALSFTAGLRWTEDKKKFTTDQKIVAVGFLTGAPLNPDGSGLADGDPLMGPLGSSSQITDRAVTPMVTLSYRWMDSLMTYASYSEGFKGGGFTQRVFPPRATIPSFGPENSRTYELGFKSDFWENKARLNGAVFWNDYNDLQVTVNDPLLGFAPIIQNAAKARIRGVELELLVVPTAEVKIQAAIGYLDAKYTEVDITAAALGSAGGVTVDDRLQNAPKWTLSAGISYDFSLGNGGVIIPRIDWNFRSTVANDAVNTQLLIQKGYHLVNLSMSYLSPDELWKVTGGVKNMTNEVYLIQGYEDAGSGLVEGTYARPREWFFTVKRSF